MAIIKIKKFSELVGGWWLRKEDTEPAPNVSDIIKSYERISKMISDLQEKNKTYIWHTLRKYGEQTDNTLINEYALNMKSKGIISCTEDKRIFIDCKYDYICFNSLTLDEQMEIIKMIDKFVSKLKGKDIIYV